MKTTMKKVMLGVALIVLAGFNASAIEDSLRMNEKKAFDLSLSDVSNSTKVTLKDRRSNILYEETIIKGGEFKKTFNMELLPEGSYTVEIENATRIQVMNLELTADDVKVSKSGSKEIYKPVLTEKGSAVYLTQFSPDEVPLYVAIYNNRNELVHEETLKGKMDLGKIYDFSKSPGGSYRFYLESDGKAYDQLVYVEK